MKHLLQITALIGLLFIAPNCLAKASKPKQVTIEFSSGAKYVGEIRKKARTSIFRPRVKVMHGKGTMYYTNGSRIEGTWLNNSLTRGTMYYANGDRFEGEWQNDFPTRGKYIFANGNIYEGTFNHETTTGTYLFANESEIEIGSERWGIPANCTFKGTFKNKEVDCGSFSLPLTRDNGDRFIGEIKESKLYKGRIEYANGNSFEGIFQNNTPQNGKYLYNTPHTLLLKSNLWHIPAGCTFKGDLTTGTGVINKEITDEKGNRFIGNLVNGKPDNGTMTHPDGSVETGKWQKGMSPREYKAFLAKQEAQKEEARQKILRTKDQSEARKQALIRKYGPKWGQRVFNGELELGMTKQMCQEVIDIQSYDIGKHNYAGHIIETWTFNKDKQDLQVAAAMSQFSGEDAIALAMFIGLAETFGATIPQYTILTFTDGKLTSLY